MITEHPFVTQHSDPLLGDFSDAVRIGQAARVQTGQDHFKPVRLEADQFEVEATEFEITQLIAEQLGVSMDHWRGGMIHCFSERFKTRKRSLVAASSVGSMSSGFRRGIRGWSSSGHVGSPDKSSRLRREAWRSMVPDHG
jgi:hypothetical protein